MEQYVLFWFRHIVINIQQRGFGHGGDDVVHHGGLHTFVQALDGIAEVGSLHEDVLRSFLLCARLFVEGDEGEFHLEPAVGTLIVRFEEFGVAGALDVAHLKLAAHIVLALFDDTLLGFGETERVHQVGLVDFLYFAIVHRTFVLDVALKPYVHHDG